MSDELRTGIVAGCMATFPKRFGIIRQVVESIAPQLDRLYIYVNETTEGFPDLSHLANVTVLDGREHLGDLSANGKVYPLKYLHDSVVFMLDDDFIFPTDYVAANRRVLEMFGGRCTVTTHGGILPPRADWYYSRYRVLSSTRVLRHMELCNLAGSGTFAFDQRWLKVDPEDFFAEVMVDLRLSLLARLQGLPIWVLPRPEGWLEHLKVEGLWEQFVEGGLTHHTHFARRYDFSFPIYRAIALGAIQRAGVDIGQMGLAPDLRDGLETGRLPANWRKRRVSFQAKNSYGAILLEAD